ncbi:hypothetical protein [Hymenobacter metallilatus]|uniref:NERD domain-containing protein n=1 Tax=Hymenobacter metallilatus TaxID=2493666 RepID=A0A428JR10_9BACT|nr:hypothetical protein [Hymenobacter metallilatus]RSK36001.1 hypothetical protein EI290_03665 [Hymenobacter metallilatus]
MLHSILFAPFTDAALQARYEATLALLTAAGTQGILLGNLPLPSHTLPAVLVQPGSVAVLLLAAGGGLLTVPALEAGGWLLDNKPWAIEEEAANPLERFRQQRAELARWLAQQPELPQPIQENDVAGLLVFEPAVHLDARAEAQLAHLPAADDFQLVPQLAQLPRRLAQLPVRLRLPAAALAEWAEALVQYGPEPPQPTEDQPPEAAPVGFWAHKARQLWGWLGAEDVPADPPYSTTLAAGAPLANEEEKHRLEQLRQQVFRELQQQRQAMEAREAEREQSIAQLRQQLRDAPSATAEVAALQARLAAETQEKQQLQAAIQASRAEAEARNQALDARIQQLGQQLELLSSRPAAALLPTPGSTAAPRPVAGAPRFPGAPGSAQPASWQLQWQRAALVLASVVALGSGLWGVSQVPAWLKASRPEQTRAQAAQPTPANDNAEAAAPTLFDIQPDTVQVADEAAGAAQDSVQLTDEAPVAEPPTPGQEEVMDSVETLPEDI